MEPIFEEDESEAKPEPQHHEQHAHHEHAHHTEPETHHGQVELHLRLSKKKAWALGILAFIIVLCVAGWQLGWFSGVIDWYSSATVNVTIVEKDTDHPIPQAKVMINGVSAQTTTEGTAILPNLKSGTVTITVTKDGYLPKTLEARIYRGVNPLSDVVLEKAPEKLFSLAGTVVDKLSALPIVKAKILAGGIEGTSNDKGEFTLQVKGDTSSLQVTKDGYEGFETTVVLSQNQVYDAVRAELLPVLRMVFEQEKSGVTDLFVTDAKGSGPYRLLIDKTAGSNSNPVVSPDQKKVAFLSDRDGTKDNGYSVNKLYMVDEKGVVTKVSDDTGVQNVRWVSSTVLVYVYSSNNKSPYQQTLVSYRIDTQKRLMLSSTPSPTTNISYSITLVQIRSDGQEILYSVDGYNDQTSNPDTEFDGIHTVKIDGTKEQKIVGTGNHISDLYYGAGEKTVRYTFSDTTGYHTHSYDLAGALDTDVTATPTVRDRDYSRNQKRADGRGSASPTTLLTKDNHYLYIDTRNSKADLFQADDSGKNESQLTKLGNVQSIILSPDEKYVLVSQLDNNSTTLYLVGSNAGTAQKVTDAFSSNAQFLAQTYIINKAATP